MKNKTITIDKKLYSNLISNQKEYQLIFDNMMTGFSLHEMIYDEDGEAVDYRYLSVNPAYSGITGIENPTGKTVKSIFPNLDQSWIDLFQNILSTGSPLKTTRYCEETKKWYNTVGFKVREKEFALLLTDITDAKEIETKKEKALYLNRTLLNAIPHPAMLISKDRIVLEANEEAKLNGAVLGKACYEGFSTCSEICQLGEYCCFCKNGLELEDIDDKNLEMPNGNRIWDTWWVPVDKDSFLYYSIDTTETKVAEQTLRESAKELEASNKELEQFAYVASHDLQEPLRVVSMYCQLIERFVEENCPSAMPPEKKAEMQQYLDFTSDATTRMRFLIKDLLEFSRVGRGNDNYEMVSLNDVLKNVVDDFDILVKENGAIIEYGDMPIIMAKSKRMNQVFHNLISNGMKFKSERDIVISITAEERDRDWLFSVSDTGIGIDEKYQERVFGIFKRLHTREEYPGTGIGLALVKKIVENHGGDIWVQSKTDIGTTFFFTIPKSWEIIKSIK